MLSRLRGRRGMTLVEVLAVVVILGILAATLAIGFGGSVARSKQNLAKTGIGQIVQRIEAYRIENGSLPSSDLGLAALSDGHALPTASYYLGSDQLIDPWGHRYLYIAPGPAGHPYEVMSLGADGITGGEDENMDITSIKLRGDL